MILYKEINLDDESVMDMEARFDWGCLTGDLRRTLFGWLANSRRDMMRTVGDCIGSVVA